MNDSVLAQLAALPEKTPAELKQLWRELYDREPPSHNTSRSWSSGWRTGSRSWPMAGSRRGPRPS
jgi:hypothetical protein